MRQLRALVALRWRMVRHTPSRRGLVALAVCFPLLLVLAVAAGQAAPAGDRLFEVLLLAPTLFVVFAVLALIAPLVAGGGNVLYPDEQLVAFPVGARAVFAGGLLMAPLNLAWTAQVVVLTGVVAAIADRGAPIVLALATTWVYVALVTTAGQALAWCVVGIRSTRRGRIGTTVLASVLLVAAALGWLSGHSADLLDRSPTTRVVTGALQGAGGQWRAWASVTVTLVVLTALCAMLGERACGWALRRHPGHGRAELARVARRPERGGAVTELLAVDAASVWRSSPLRRGVLVLALLPGAVAMLTGPSWPALTLLPGLVAAGAGLLFGVNAFCLDGSGAVWVATLPHRTRLTLVSKVLITAAVCLAAVVLALLLALTRVSGSPSATELVALTGAVLGSTVLVVAWCARSSLRHPHKADLTGPRDTPAPPGAMAVYSLRLALTTTWTGLLYLGAAASGSVGLAVAVSLLVLVIAGRSLVQTFTLWGDNAARARVVLTVASG